MNKNKSISIFFQKQGNIHILFMLLAFVLSFSTSEDPSESLEVSRRDVHTSLKSNKKVQQIKFWHAQASPSSTPASHPINPKIPQCHMIFQCMPFQCFYQLFHHKLQLLPFDFISFPVISLMDTPPLADRERTLNRAEKAQFKEEGRKRVQPNV